MSDIFDSFFMAGFECSSHRRKDGVRLDLIRATRHDNHALDDYRRCAEHGLTTIRDGLRWHLIEVEPGRYDWSSWLPMVEAAAEAGIRIIWDMYHYGCPTSSTSVSPEFITALPISPRPPSPSMSRPPARRRSFARSTKSPSLPGRSRPVISRRRTRPGAAGSSASWSAPRSPASRRCAPSSPAAGSSGPIR